MAKDRIEFIDLAKGICIILVVIYHFCGPFQLNHTRAQIFLISFRMPLFYMLSGMFFSKYSGIKELIVKKCNKLLIPFVVFSVLSFFVYFTKYKILGRNIEHGLIYSITHEFIPFNNPLWFLFSLFTCSIIFYWLLSFSSLFRKKNVVLSLSALILGVAGFLLGKNNINLPLWIDSSMTAIPFYALGYFLRTNTLFLTAKCSHFFNLSLAAILFLITWFYGRYSDVRINLTAETTLLRYYFCGIAGSLAVLLVSKSLNRLPIVSFFGKYSICIFVTHSIFINLIMRYLIEIISYQLNFSAGFIAIVFAILFLPSYLLIIPFMIKYMPHVCAQKDLLVYGNKEGHK